MGGYERFTMEIAVLVVSVFSYAFDVLINDLHK